MENGESNGNPIKSGEHSKRPSKIRDIFTDRVVGIVSGAAIPLVLLLIPILNKYLDKSYEIQALQIQNNVENLEHTNRKLAFLTEALVGSQIQQRTLTEDLAKAITQIKELKLGCDDYCRTLKVKK